MSSGTDDKVQAQVLSKIKSDVSTCHDLPEARLLLEEYGSIASEDVISRIEGVRDKGLEIYPWPCVGQLAFLRDYLRPRPCYSQILSLLRSGAQFLDVGCGFGQGLRYRVYKDGVPASQLWGFDLEQPFLDLGFELFGDRERFGPQLFAASIFLQDEAGESRIEGANKLEQLKGNFEVIYASQVLHTWDWDNQLKAAKNLVSLSKPQPGSLIAGDQMGSLNAGPYPMPMMPTGNGFHYRHDMDTMKKFWAQVGEETGTLWDVEGGMYTTAAIERNKDAPWAKIDPGMRMIWFSACRR